MFIAQFAAHYYKDYKIEQNDAQPDTLTDDVLESHQTSADGSLPKIIRLLDTNELMKCRQVKALVRSTPQQKERT